MYTSIAGGFKVSDEDLPLLNTQRAITMQINNQFIQVGAIFLRMAGKNPIDDDWVERLRNDTNLQSWIDEESHRLFNVGFNLQLGWMDIDIDAEDPAYNRAMIAALEFNGVDTRFRFGRKSVGNPTHVLVQLGEEEAANFEGLSRFEPREFRIDGRRYHTQLRSYPTNIADKKNLYRSAKQTVMPGSIYTSKSNESDYDISVWYGPKGIATNVRDIAATTPRRTSYNQILRSIAFATFVYVLAPHWVEGQRQSTVNKVAGWLARVVKDGEAMNNHETISADVFCPVDTDDIAESLISFAAGFFGDEEKHMRIRSFRDAREKLDRNPDAKIPGWPAMEALLGAAAVNALRTTFTPGSDVSILTRMAERYAYDETDGQYIDRDRHRNNHETFTHEPALLERRHIDETVVISGKPRPAFKMYETSKMRVRVATRDLYPNLDPGVIFRVNKHGDVVSDDDLDDDTGGTVFNTWRGWPLALPHPVDDALMNDLIGRLDYVLDLLTCGNQHQIEWVKDWIAWTFQHPADKQQIAWVCVGGQGVGKSWFGNVFLPSVFGALWGSTSASIIDQKFNVGPFINKMMVFVDEVKFHNESGTDEVKKLIRNVNVGGMEKFGEGRNYKIYARMFFASNRFDMSLGQSSVIDRALFYTKAYDAKYKQMSDADFREWANTLKPWFDEFSTLLLRMDVRQHLFHYFMHRPCNRHEIESIRYSSGQDAEITTVNMRPSRRIAKYILEEGRIYEDLSIEAPFDMRTLGIRIGEVAETLHIKPMRTDLVISEWEDAGLLTKKSGKFCFKYRELTTIEKFEGAISVPLDRRYEYGPDDVGDNDNPGRKPWKGSRPGVVQSHKQEKF